MTKVKIDCKHKSYDVLIGEGLLKKTGEILKEYMSPCSAVLVTDSNVDSLYAGGVEQSLKKAGFNTFKFVFPHGEGSKNLGVLAELLEFMAANGITRSDLTVALGGGVTGDLAGFASAVYMRGIRFVQIPTTFLAAIDSSVGGKTGVNLKAGKNLAGAFWQPELVICDTESFNTLSREVMADGIAEAIKYGVIKDKNLFDTFCEGDWRDLTQKIVARCVEIKGEVVNKDELDKGERQLLNFGHTLGHAIEKLSGYTVAHGHGVAVGMVLITRAAERRGIAEKGSLNSLIVALKKQGLPVSCDYYAAQLTEAALSDKKRTGEKINLIVPRRIGEAEIMPLPVEELAAFIYSGLSGEDEA